ncbi:MAG TPA: hypothetical protein DCP36_02410 [Sporomusaceae bacterium]|nr:hypothetical protein [Sporomusaceae bacterium]
MKIFTRVSHLLRDKYPSLTVCSNNGSPIKVMQWQCSGEININKTVGVKKEDSPIIDKARKFSGEALFKMADLVLTPEYSFPFSVLNEIVSNPAMWPRPGQLWCLGTQGENRDILEQTFSVWKNNSNTYLFDIAVSNLEHNNFVSPLIYLFITQDNNLCILPQFKTGSMADARNSFEGPNLCRGKHIFIFDHKDCQNVFLSLICADAMHIPSSEISQNIAERHIILFHPQLNPDPRYSDLVTFRQSFFRTDQKDVRIITLNWSEGTLGQFENHLYKFDIPWSAYFKRSRTSLSDKSLRNNKEANHKTGTGYVVSDRIEVWFSSRLEHCKFFIISKGDNGDSLLPVVHRDDPTTDSSYTYDVLTKRWVSGQLGCASNIKDMFAQYGIPTDLPYPVCLTTSSCDKCKKTDFFYGSIFGQFEDNEMICSDEKNSRILVSSDKNSDKLRDDKFDLLLHLKRLLDQGELPCALKYLKNNYRFKVSDDFPSQGLYQYNVTPIHSLNRDAEALVVITNEMDVALVEKLVKHLSDSMSERYRNQILVYYRAPGNGYVIYDKHLSNKSIIQPKFSINLSSIKHATFKLFRRGGNPSEA